MAARTLLLLISSVTLPGAHAAASVVLPDDLIVRVYDVASVETAVASRALGVASRALADANVGVAWLRCGDGWGVCNAPRTSRDIVLRFVRGDRLPAGRKATDPASLRSRHGLPLGDAAVDPSARTGVLATIYVDRVMLLAEASDADPATLLGYAIAHELGHLLLGTTRHPARGLMRAVWSAGELRAGHTAAWRFTRDEAAAMRERLDGQR